MNKKQQLLVEKSGMMTHLKVIDCLKSSGWSVVVSPYYYDGVADLVKEIDIVAEKQFSSAERAHISSVQVNVQLFIECKYVNQEVMLWFDKPDTERAVEALQRDSGLQLAVRTSGDITPDSFRYLKAEKVAKLFTTNSGKEDIIYKALSQSLRSLVYYKQWAPGPVANQFNGHSELVSHIVRYPVVVCDNFKNLKEVVVGEGLSNFVTKDLLDSFLLETNYVYFNKAKTTTINDYFWVDFVDTNYLATFLQSLESEVKGILRAKSFVQHIQQTHQRERSNPGL